jgi:hypothetical protein
VVSRMWELVWLDIFYDQSILISFLDYDLKLLGVRKMLLIKE